MYMVMQDVNRQLFIESVMDEVLLGSNRLKEKDINTTDPELVATYYD